jgi:hypothetical protein
VNADNDGYVFDPEDFPDICDECGHEIPDCTCAKEPSDA